MINNINNNVKRKTWNCEDIKKLIQAKQQGMRIKNIAKMFQITHVAVSKALQRYYNSNYENGVFTITNNNPNNNEANNVANNNVVDCNFGKRKHQRNRCDGDLWVTMNTAIDWLQQNNFNIKKLDTTIVLRNSACCLEYRIDQNFLTSSQAIYLTNIERLKQGLPLFYVLGIAYE